MARFIGVDDAFVPPVVGGTLNRYYGYRSHLAFRAARKLPKRLGDHYDELVGEGGAIVVEHGAPLSRFRFLTLG